MQVHQEKLDGQIATLKKNVREAQGWLIQLFIDLGHTKDTATYKAGGITQDYELLKRLNLAAAAKEEKSKPGKS